MSRLRPDVADEGDFAGGERGRSNPFTPARLLLGIVVVLAAAVAGFGLAVAKSVPMTVSGLAVLGVGLFALAAVAVSATVRAGRGGAGGTALVAALLGGVCAIGASGSLALAIVLGLLAAR